MNLNGSSVFPLPYSPWLVHLIRAMPIIPSFTCPSLLAVDLTRCCRAFPRTFASLAASILNVRAQRTLHGIRGEYNLFTKQTIRRLIRSTGPKNNSIADVRKSFRWIPPYGSINNRNGDSLNTGNGDTDSLATTSKKKGSLSAKQVLAQVITYNILSSSLALPSRYKHYDPHDLEAEVRLPRVLHKLESPVTQRAIICLQELSMKWAGTLHKFFANRGYHLVYAPYGPKHNGYMGVGIAVPMDHFQIVDVSLEKITDTVRWPMKMNHGFFSNGLGERLRKSWRVLTGMKRDGRKDPWGYSKDRTNVLVFTRLLSRQNGGILCVGTYHMPCAFWSPPVMLIHSMLVVSRFQDLSGGDDSVLAGDFNIQPGSPCYEMITKGDVSEEHRINVPMAPDGTDGHKWLPVLVQPMKSAYAEKMGREPDFTNYAKVVDDDPFIDTLDYIFCSPRCDIVDIVRLPHRRDVNGPFPSRSEPSDHILMGATFRVHPPAPLNEYGAAV